MTALKRWVGNLNFMVDPHNYTTQNNTTYVYNERNQLTDQYDPDPGDGNGTPHSHFGYDSVGRLHTITDPLSRVTTYDYDAQDNLTYVTMPDPGSSQPIPQTGYTYDGVGNLLSTSQVMGLWDVQYTSDSQTDLVTSYGYDHQNRLHTATTHPTTSTSSVTTYVYDSNGNLMSFESHLRYHS